MSLVNTGTKITYEDYLEIPNDGKRHEIIDGEHFVTPAPFKAHQQAVGRLYRELAVYVQKDPVGEVYLAPFDVILSDVDVVQPDLLFLRAARAGLAKKEGVRGAPDLVVEVLSPSSRKHDEKTKRGLYDRAGVQEYWIVDTDLATIKVWQRTPAGFERVAELEADAEQALQSPLLPGFSLPLKVLFDQI